MTPQRYRQVGELYHAALALPPQDREVFLQKACNGDAELRHEVEQLLASHEEAGSFLAGNFMNAPALQAKELLAEDQTEALIGKRLGQYQILSRIGKGGMGEVYLATDEALARQVALKLLPAEFAADPERLHRFEREARAAAATAHPNIVAIHEIGECDGIHFIAEEFVEGQTLRRRIEDGRLPLLEALDIAAQTADALAAAHAAGIVHRDIKPENLMLRPDGYVKVLDFGLASLSRPLVADSTSSPAAVTGETTPGTILGTVNYMSPEQTRGQKADARSDLWSLGVVLYEMLTQRRPFNGESAPDVFVAILDREPPPLSSSLKAPPELESLLAGLLAKNRAQRSSSASLLAAELKRLHRRLELENERDAETKASALTVAGNSAPALKPNANPIYKESAAVTRPRRAMIVPAIFLAIGLMAIIWWMLGRQNTSVASTPAAESLPERSFSYSLTVQKMRDGKPYQTEFQSSGRDFYENGWRFRLNFHSPQPGYLYIINEGPAAGGAISYRLLFPLPSINGASAGIEPGRKMTTGWYQFNAHPGNENFWMLWMAQPLDELEKLKSLVLNARTQGEISAPQQRDAVRALLEKLNHPKTEIREDKVKLQTEVLGKGEALIHLVELKHH